MVFHRLEGASAMLTSGTQDRSPTPFPRWLGGLWLFLVFLEKGWDWQSLLIYGGVPWLCAWGIWTIAARTSYVREISADTIVTFWRCAAGAMWLGAIGVGGGIYYANHHLPRGPMYATGDVVCQNDDRGPCGEEYREDVRGLDIPDWAKFLKGSKGDLLFMGFIVAGIFAIGRVRGGYTETNDYDEMGRKL